MAFPTTPLGAVVELQIDGAWTDITTDVRTASGIQITRGRSDESSRVTPGRCSLALNNTTGTYSPRNPSSAYYGLLGRNTPLRVSVKLAEDGFNRTVSNGWGTDDTGNAWTTTGTATNFSVAPSEGVHSLSVVNTPLHTTAGTARDLEITFATRVPRLSSGDWQRVGAVMRWSSSSDFYWFNLAIDAAGQAVHAQILKQTAGVLSTVETVNSGLTHTALSLYRVRAQAERSTLRLKVWLDGTDEPAAWNVEATDTTHTAAGAWGFRSRVDPLNTNTLPAPMYYSDLQVVDTRFHGEVSQWPPKWNEPGTDVYVPIEASGILRRLGQGASPLRSPLTRGTLAISGLVAYWPMEEESGATQFTAAVGGSPLMGAGFTPAGASETGLDGSLPVATIGSGARLSASVTGTGASGEWLIRGIVYVPTEPAAAIRLLEWHTTGTAQGWHVRINPAGELIELQAFDGANATILNVNAAAAAEDLYGKWTMWEVGATQNGANIDYHIILRYPDGESGGFTGTLNSYTAGVIKSVALTGDVEYRCGHISVYDDNPGFASAPVIADLQSGFSGETAVARITRLCEEEGVPLTIIGTAAESEPVGAQRSATLLDLIQDAADADHGILFEPRQGLAIGYRTRASLYNQTAALALDYDAGHLSGALEPVDDDQAIRNDVTVQRFNGSEARAVLESGALSVQSPPDGVGRYDESVSLNVETDERLPQTASWRLHLGTWDEARYPSVEVSLSRSAFSGSASRTRSATELHAGDVVTIDDMPSWLPPNLVELLVQGFDEYLEPYRWRLRWNCSPAGPYTVGVYDSSASRYESSGTTRQSSTINTTQTGITLTIATGTPFWTTDAGQFPFDINIGGERMTVTDIDAAIGQTQLFTVTRSVNGVVKSHPVGSVVTLWSPARYAL